MSASKQYMRRSPLGDSMSATRSARPSGAGLPARSVVSNSKGFHPSPS